MKAKTSLANLYWFPLAALYAALVLPLSVGGLLNWFPVPAGLEQAWGHGHEMIFGFALAVIAGYITGAQPKSQTFIMLAWWLLARVSFWFAPTHIFTAFLNSLFLGALAWKLAPVFLRTAKKWRNKSTGVILIGLAASGIGFHSVLQNYSSVVLSLKFLMAAILLLSGLMFFMGGRIISPALAGIFKQRQFSMQDRVQPRLEGSILILLLLTLVFNFISFNWAAKQMAGLLISCTFLGALRILRWRPWWCLKRPDMLALLLGYAWVLVGWIYIALSLINPLMPITQALHAMTIGALGTLTLTVMARGRTFRVLRDCNAKPFIYLLPLLISFAAVLRLNAIQLGYSSSIMLSTLCWSLAFTGLFIWLLWLAKVKSAQ